MTINLSVRWDHKSAGGDELVLQDFQQNPTGVTFPAIDTLYTWTPISPRIGFNYSLTEDGRTILKAHYGRYYRQIITCEYCINLGASPHENLFGFWDFEAEDFVDLEVIQSIPGNRGIDPDYTNPYTDQFIVGFERELSSDLALSVNYVYKRGRDYAAWNDIRGVYEEATYIDDQGADATGATIPVLNLLSGPGDRFFEITNDERMNTRIHAFTVQFIKRMSDNWQTNTSFSYTDTFGILPSGRGSTTGGQSTALVFSSFGQNPNDFVNMEGQLNGQRPWMFKSQFLYQFPQDFLLALNYTLQAGKAYARRVRVPETGLSTEINAETRDGSRQVGRLEPARCQVAETLRYWPAGQSWSVLRLPEPLQCRHQRERRESPRNVVRLRSPQRFPSPATSTARREVPVLT